MTNVLPAPIEGEALILLRSKVRELLALLKVQRVVAVDDEFGETTSLEEYLGIIQLLAGQERLEAVFPDETDEIPLDAVNQRAQAKWDSLSAEGRETLYEALLVAAGRQSAPDHVNDLHEIFGEVEFIPLSPNTWDRRRDTYLAEAATRKTLFLFDENHDKMDAANEAGLNQLAFVLGHTTDDAAVCALLSHTFTSVEEEAAWNTRVTKLGLPPHQAERFIPISKDRLRAEPSNLVVALRTAGLSKFLNSFRNKALDALTGAQVEARRILEGMDVVELEHVLFSTSDYEGVSEMDTLFRIYGALHRQQARHNVRGEPGIREESRRLRHLRELAGGPPFKGSAAFTKVRRMELYEDAEDLNNEHIPLDLGDVFRHKSEKIYVLLAPQCDLVVRAHGRKATEGILVEIVSQTKRVNSNQLAMYYELPPFWPAEGKSFTYASFQNAHSIRLDALDPVVFSSSGDAILGNSIEAPLDALKHWQTYHKTLQDRWHQELEVCRQWRQQQAPLNVIQRAIHPVSLFKPFEPEIDLEAGTIHYGFKRIGRLTPARAYALLTAYMQFIARPAYEHDFSSVP